MDLAVVGHGRKSLGLLGHGRRLAFRGPWQNRRIEALVHGGLA